MSMGRMAMIRFGKHIRGVCGGAGEGSRGGDLALGGREVHLEGDGGPELRGRARVLGAGLLQFEAVEGARVAGDAGCQAAADVHRLAAQLLRTARRVALRLRLCLRQQLPDGSHVRLHIHSHSAQQRLLTEHRRQYHKR